MKIYISMKTPDALIDAAREASNNAMEVARDIGNLPQEDLVEAGREAHEEVMKAGKRFFMHNELVVLELDTEANTCVAKLLG